MSNQLIVVVEDDRDVRDVITEVLRNEGYAVEAIGDGPSACDRIHAINEKMGPIAVITLDLSLPGRDGNSILRELKTNPAMQQVPVVIISASLPLLAADIRPLAAAVIRKPFDVMHLVDTVSALIGRHLPPTSLSPTTALVNRPLKP